MSHKKHKQQTGGYNIASAENTETIVRTVRDAKGNVRQVKFPKESKILTRDKFILHDVVVIDKGLVIGFDTYDMITETGKKMSFHRPDVKAFSETYQYAPQINWKQLGVSEWKPTMDLVYVLNSVDHKAISEFVYNLNKYAKQTGMEFDIQEAVNFFSSYPIVDIHSFLDYLNYLEFEKAPAYIRKQTFMKPENSLLSGVWASDTPVWVVDLGPSKLPKQKGGVVYYDDKSKIAGVRNPQ